MASRDQALSDYVRYRIGQWRDEEKRELQELARIAGIAKSSPSQVLLGTGVAKKTGKGYARAFGFASYEALQEKAYRWWLERGQAAATAIRAPHEPALAQAIDFVKNFKQATDAQIRTILADLVGPRWADRDVEWWIATLATELERDRRRGVEERTRAADVERKQDRIRETHDRAKREWGEVSAQRTARRGSKKETG